MMKKRVIILFVGIFMFMIGCGNDNNGQYVEVSNTEIENVGNVLDESKTKDEKNVLIQNQLKLAEEYYEEYDFDNIGKCYDELDNLGYDTIKLREVYNYDRETYDDAFTFYNTLLNVKRDIETGSYTSVVVLVNELRDVAKKFDLLSVKMDSKIGQYISGIQNNPMYYTLKTNVLDLEDSTFQEGIVENGFAEVIKLQLDKMLEVESPFEGESKEKENAENGETDLTEIISLVRERAMELSQNTTTVHVDPSFGNQYYAFETIDAYKDSVSDTGRKCTVQIRCFQRLNEKNCMLDFALFYYDALNYDVLKVIVSNDIESVEIGQQDIISQEESFYVSELSTEKISTEDLKSSALKLFEMGNGTKEVYIKVIGAENEDIIRLTDEQKESLVYISGVWLSILEEYK